MPPSDPVTPNPSAADPAAPGPKQSSFEALNALLASSNAAANNPDNTQAARDAAWATRTATAKELEALDLAVFTGNTADLQAAAAAMKPGIDELNALKKKISALGNAFKEAGTIIADIDKAVAQLTALV